MVFKVTPWDVSGKIDYKKLEENFGLSEFDRVPKKFNDFLLYRRGLIFAQRDFLRINNAIVNKKPFSMITGLMPSGKFHFGHKMLVDEIIFYQSIGAKTYIAVADVEAYNTRNPNLDELRKTAINEYLTNYVALGLDLKKCDFYFQSARSLDAKKSNAYYCLAKTLARYVTFNEFKAVYGEISPAKMSSALLQAADMLHPQLKEFGYPMPTIIPVGTDQDPHIRLARDISYRAKQYKFVQLSSTYHKFLPGLKGGKMSSSDTTSYISLTEDLNTVAKKIKKYAFSGGQDTVKKHRKLGGNPDVDVSFQMLLYGLEEDDKMLEEIYHDYKSGALLTGDLKKLTIEKLQRFLNDHEKKREKSKKKINSFIEKNFNF